MAAVGGDTTYRLLCHLGWLAQPTIQHTLDWARRVYNSAAHLQFRFVYPQSRRERIDQVSAPLLAKALEELVSLAHDVVAPLREGPSAAKQLSSPLPTSIARVLHKALVAALDSATQVGWVGVFVPHEHSDLDAPVDPLKLLAEWRRSQDGLPQDTPATTASTSSEADVATDEFCQGLGTLLVARHSPTMSQVPEKVSEIINKVADTHFSVDVQFLGQAGGDQRLQALATDLLPRREDG